MDDIWKLKIQAFLHDPFDKPLVLFSEKHEIRAAKFLALLLGIPDIPKKVKEADRIASAMSRIIIPSGGRGLDFVKNPILVNPLSGEKYDLGKLEKFDEEGANFIVEKAKEVLEASVKRIKDEFQNDLRKVFLALWRRLPQELSEESSSGRLGYLWHLLPADTRVPDHSIWDHISLASSVASALPNPSLAIFTLGPVQEFIALARRTQDLWMGSFLLSYLIWHGMKVIADEYGPDSIVFPNLYKQPLVDLWLFEEGVLQERPSKFELQTPSFPNRFLAFLPNSEAPNKCDAAKKALFSEWEKICQRVREIMEESLKINNDSKWDELWQKQTRNFFEVYWVVYPWTSDPKEALKQYKQFLGLSSNFKFGKLLFELQNINSNFINSGTVYQILYDLAERSLGSRKSLKNFEQVEEEDWKCTLCGIRESLHLKNQSKRKQIKSFWKNVAKTFPSHFLLEGRERLCAICSVKRLAGEYYFKETLGVNLQFPSTSTIAVDSFREFVIDKLSKNSALKNKLSEFTKAMEKLLNDEQIKWTLNVGTTPRVSRLARKLSLDVKKFATVEGEWLFKESFSPEKIKREFGVTFSEDQLDRLRETLNNVIECVEAKPSSYYAIFYMDGDEMGKWLSGEKAPFIEQVLHPVIKGELSRSNLKNILEYKRPLSPALHNAICKALRDFSHEIVRLVVEKRYPGKLVYAGGDDVLAFAPLSCLLDIISELRKLYSGDRFESDKGIKVKSKNGYVKIGDNLFAAMGSSATASTGVTIAHYTHPLGNVLRQVRIAERKAKEHYGRNAFVISILKRSGEVMQTGFKWSYGEIDTIEIVKKVISYFQSDVLASRFAYAISREVEVFKGLNIEHQELELKRLLGRHIDKRKVSPEERREIISMFIKFLQCLNDNHGKEGFGDFAKIFLMSRFLAKESMT